MIMFKAELTAAQIQSILDLKVENVQKVYSGRPTASGNHCRCGCCGTYRYNPLLKDAYVGSNADRGYPIEAEDLNLGMVKKVLRGVQALAASDPSHLTVAEDFSWVDAELPSGRSYTLYLVEGV